MDAKPSGVSRLIEPFLQGNFTVLLIMVSLIAGAISLSITPREEEPQITVPLADVMVAYPGGSAAEVERRVASRLERLLYQIDGVEYVYSMSRPGMAVVTVRFYVGQDREESLIKLYNKVFQNVDRTTPGIAGWVIKPVEIDDVPIVTAALYSRTADTHALRRVAEEVAEHLQRVPDVSNVTIHGGERRVLRIEPDMERLAAHHLSVPELLGALKVSNARLAAGAFEQANREILVEAGPFLQTADDVKNLMVGAHNGRPVYVRDVAAVLDGPEETATYTRIGFGPAAGHETARGAELGAAPPADPGDALAAVTVAVAKKRGTNAVRVAREVRAALETLQGQTIPDDVRVRLTRNYGETANDKVNDLVENLWMAVITVVGLIAFTMGWREGIIIALAIPITYSLTLLANYLFGYTINRVTLFALILALGLLVDSPIVGVENIQRHLRAGSCTAYEAVVRAMNEVVPPIVPATLAIIVSFIPMFFISGMMGPYMAPMALNVPLTMLSSMLVAVMITPWLALKLLKPAKGDEHCKLEDVRTTPTYRIYSRVLAPLVDSRGRSLLMLAVIVVLFAGSVGLAVTGRVPLKMLPFDNKNEFQVVVDLPESSTLEATDAVVRRVEDYLRTLPEVVDFTATVGAGSPMDFNGLVRHYYLRQGPAVADVRVNLVHRKKRAMDSHGIILRIRNDIARLAQETGAQIKLVEAPPGPPVLSTIVAEVYGGPHHRYDELIVAAKQVSAALAGEPGVVEVDDMVEADQPKLSFITDREKAGLSGVATEDVTTALRFALSGLPGGELHDDHEQNETPILLRMARADRSDPARLAAVPLKGRTGAMVQLGELGRFEERIEDKTIFHKNLQRVVFVTAEMAGRGPAYAVLGAQKALAEKPLPPGIRASWVGEGEWKITVDVFRDLGIAFGVALLAIYVLLVYETKSNLLPLIIMMSIPLTVIGIMPGFWVLNLLVDRPIGGYANPVFFTATAMIGMIALGGIVQRNAILLIDFIRVRMKEGATLREAILESGAVRFRPIFLTAATTLLGAWPITFDPIFSGLAWAIIFGLFVSTAFTLVVIPVVYNLVYGRKPVPATGEPS